MSLPPFLLNLPDVCRHIQIRRSAGGSTIYFVLQGAIIIANFQSKYLFVRYFALSHKHENVSQHCYYPYFSNEQIKN